MPSFFAARRDYCVADIYLESPDGSRHLAAARHGYETLCGVS